MTLPSVGRLNTRADAPDAAVVDGGNIIQEPHGIDLYGGA
jgi:hypothetical protein